MSDGGSSGLMAVGLATQATSGLVGAMTQSEAFKNLGNYQKSQYDFNASIAKLQAKDAQDRGDYAVHRNDEVIKQAVGSERSSSAAQGVDVNSGTVNQGQKDTRFQGAMNDIQIKNNAWREQWGYTNQATQASFAGTFAQMSGQNQANNTLLTGGINSLAYLAKAGVAFGGFNTKTGSINGYGNKYAGDPFSDVG